MSRLFISAAHKSSGKTTVSIGLCAAFGESGKIVQAFKKGPDYIDPHWLALATKRNCYNLDFYTMSEDEILSSLAKHSADADISIIEGNKGLYDGLDIDGSNSNAALAKLIQTPVVLVLDARGMTRGIAPLILGYQNFDSSIKIKGVILNQLGGSRHEDKLRNVIEHYTDVEVVGAIHKDKRFDIDERHLGLMPGYEDPSCQKKIDQLKNAIQDQVNLEQLMNIATEAEELTTPDHITPSRQRQSDVTIGIIRNKAFGFYYPDDLENLQNAGAKLIEIDNLKDTSLPDIDGLIIGGGFPEMHMQALSENSKIRGAIHAAIENGLPVYAECGGLMYLAKSIEWNNDKYDMVGSIGADVIMENNPQGRGYVQLKETSEAPWPASTGGIIAAHEFHYSHFKNMDNNAKFSYEVLRGTGINGKYDGYIHKNLLACYTHQRSTADNPWTQRFIDFVRQHKR